MELLQTGTLYIGFGINHPAELAFAEAGMGLADEQNCFHSNGSDNGNGHLNGNGNGTNGNGNGSDSHSDPGHSESGSMLNGKHPSVIGVRYYFNFLKNINFSLPLILA